MNNTETINSLKNAGFKVRIKHFRPVDWQNSNDPIRYQRRNKEFMKTIHKANIVVSQFGGYTIAEIGRDGHAFIGTANCHVKDNFNYKLATRIALGRAKKELTRRFFG